MNRILIILSEGQDPKIKRLMYRRVSALMANVRYMKETRSEQLMFIEEQGWHLEHFEIIFALSAFYLLVLGPLMSSARGRSGTVWHDLPILYGKDLVFDNERAKQIRSAHQSFSRIAERIPGGLETLTGNQASDIVFRLYRAMNRDFDNF
jgi:hypothetical protein